MRAALERISMLDALSSHRQASSAALTLANEALAEVDALPENDTECYDCADWQREANRAYAMEQAAEARLAQIAEYADCGGYQLSRQEVEHALHTVAKIARGEEAS